MAIEFMREISNISVSGWNKPKNGANIIDNAPFSGLNKAIGLKRILELVRYEGGGNVSVIMSVLVDGKYQSQHITFDANSLNDLNSKVDVGIYKVRFRNNLSVVRHF